jgi:hypothetical protein
MRRALKFAMFIAAGSALLHAETVEFRQRCLQDLIAEVPRLLKSQDPKTGRFGTGIWIVTDQNVMLPLAAAWWFKDHKNPYYHDAKILNALMAAGDALIDDQDETGQWVFRKKDGSTWGKIYMPWTYSRWIRAFAMIRDAMPAERRARWEKALLLGHNGIAQLLNPSHIQNIPAHHAMGLYFAGDVFGKPEWKKKAADYLHAVVAAQHSDGYWSENKGPVVNYGFVYVDAVGTYYGVSHDASVLNALRKTAMFHYYFTYPDGSNVETVDERNPYHGGVQMPNVGFAFTPEGRSYIARQWRLHKGPIPADSAASLLLWGEEGEAASIDVSKSDFDYRLPSGDAEIRRRGSWFIVVSAMTAAVPNSRWIQDRQNFVSVFHEKAGLILGGGNTKLQPAWSNFTVGDTSAFFHKPGDENPNFQPPAGLLHVPDSAHLLDGKDCGVDLHYGAHQGRIVLEVKDADRLEVRLSGDKDMTVHVTLLPRLKEAVTTASVRKAVLDNAPIDWKSGTAGQWLELRGVRVGLPASAAVRWPLLAHDPYKKDGSATLDEGRMVVDIPASQSGEVLTLRVMK